MVKKVTRPKHSEFLYRCGCCDDKILTEARARYCELCKMRICKACQLGAKGRGPVTCGLQEDCADRVALHVHDIAVNMLQLYGCQRAQWTGTAKRCVDLPGSPQLCALCFFCQASGTPVPTREDLVKYYESRR